MLLPFATMRERKKRTEFRPTRDRRSEESTGVTEPHLLRGLTFSITHASGSPSRAQAIVAILPLHELGDTIERTERESDRRDAALLGEEEKDVEIARYVSE